MENKKVDREFIQDLAEDIVKYLRRKAKLSVPVMDIDCYITTDYFIYINKICGGRAVSYLGAALERLLDSEAIRFNEEYDSYILNEKSKIII